MTAFEDDAEVLYDFGTGEVIRRWSPIDDRVMGGVSRSELAASGEGTALFRGQLSVESGGGFASVRSAPEPRDLSARLGIALRQRRAWDRAVGGSRPLVTT